MLNRSALIVFLLVVLLARANSQQLSHQVLVPAANVQYYSGVNYSQTIGETVVEIVSAYDHTLTQGFQQPSIDLDVPPPPNGTGVDVYPNPVTEYVKVELFGETAREFSIMIVNINGTPVYLDQLIFSSSYWYIEEVPVASFIRGIYFVRVMSMDGVINRTFKIEKM